MKSDVSTQNIQWSTEMQYKQRLSIVLIVVCGLFFIDVNCVWAQKKNNNRQDEKRENERVQKAERDLADARKQLGKNQTELKSALRKLDAAQNKLVAAKHDLRDAEDQAEAELGESIGIPPAIPEVNENRKAYERISQPILDQLHARPEWKTLQAQVAKAKADKAALREDVELEDAQREDKLKALNLIIERPFAVETKVLQAVPECAAAREKLDKSSAKLAELKKKLTPGKVEAHPKVTAASKSLRDIESVVRVDEKAVAVERSSASKAQRAVASAQAALTKARQADAKDSNKNNNKGKKK